MFCWFGLHQTGPVVHQTRSVRGLDLGARSAGAPDWFGVHRTASDQSGGAWTRFGARQFK
jgi:hypothetical protein